MSRVLSALQVMRAALRTKTGRHTQMVFGGQIVSAAFGFGTNVLLLRCLSIDEYGLFSLFLSTLMMLAGFMHMGWIETFVRFGAKTFGTPEFAAIRNLLLKRTLVSSAIVGAMAMGAASLVSERFYHRPEFVPYFYAAAIGGLLNSCFTFFQNEYRARQDFNRYLVTQVGSNATRLACVALATVLGVLGLTQTVGIYLGVTFTFIILCAVHLRDRRGHAPLVSLEPSLLKEMTSYNGWLLLSFFTTNAVGNIDAHLLAHFHANNTLSSYSAAARLTLPLQFVAMSLQTTLLPRLSASKDPRDVVFYLDRLKLFFIPFVALTALATWLAPPILIWIAGPHYANITSLLRLQILTYAVMLVVNPIGIVTYAWGWTRMLAFMNLGQLVLDVVLDLLWIPRWGAMGAVAATLAVNVLGFVVIYPALWWGLKQRKSVT